MLADLILKEFRGSERLTNQQQDELAQYQVELFWDNAPVQTQRSKGTTTKRWLTNTKCPWVVRGQRSSAHLHINGFDHQLLIAIGVGLVIFHGSADDAAKVAMDLMYHGVIVPAFVLNLDECSPAYSMTCF